MNWPALRWNQVAAVSSEVLRQADARARDDFGIAPLQLMEIAGWQIARFTEAFMDGVGNKRILVVAGSGNNGGDALVAARFLHQRGALVTASAVAAKDPDSLVAQHAATIARLGIRISKAPAGIDPSVDTIVDGLFGTGIRPPLREPAARIVAAMNATGRPIVSIDVPSGLDADTGAGAETAIRAAATVTLAAPKAGLTRAPNAGRVFVADIGMPASLFSADRAAIEVIYRAADLVELVDPDLL